MFPAKSSMFSCIHWKGTTTTNHVRVKSLGVTNVQPWAMQNLLMPHPRTNKAGKCPAVAQEEGGWAQVELADAL